MLALLTYPTLLTLLFQTWRLVLIWHKRICSLADSAWSNSSGDHAKLGFLFNCSCKYCWSNLRSLPLGGVGIDELNLVKFVGWTCKVGLPFQLPVSTLLVQSSVASPPPCKGSFQHPNIGVWGVCLLRDSTCSNLLVDPTRWASLSVSSCQPWWPNLRSPLLRFFRQRDPNIAGYVGSAFWWVLRRRASLSISLCQPWWPNLRSLLFQTTGSFRTPV